MTTGHNCIGRLESYDITQRLMCAASLCGAWSYNRDIDSRNGFLFDDIVTKVYYELDQWKIFDLSYCINTHQIKGNSEQVEVDIFELCHFKQLCVWNSRLRIYLLPQKTLSELTISIAPPEIDQGAWSFYFPESYWRTQGQRIVDNVHAMY